MDYFSALKTFCAVVQARSFAEAALRTGKSRSAVSKSIRELEEYLGATLFRRTTRSINLTGSGEAYFSSVMRLLTQLQDADDLARQANGKPTGLLRVTAPVSLGLLYISPLISSFSLRYPDITLDLVLSDEKVHLLNDRFDIAIRGSSQSLDASSTVARRIGSFSHILCASPKYLAGMPTPQLPQDLQEHRCLVYSGTGLPACWEFERADEHCSVTLNAAYSCNNSLALRQSALLGLGIVRIPDILVRQELIDGTLIQVMPQWSSPSLDMWILYPSATFMSQRLRLFIDFVAQDFQSVNIQ